MKSIKINHRTLGQSISLILMASSSVALAGTDHFSVGNLVVSRSVYNNLSSNVVMGQKLPPNCTTGCVTAISDGTYPQIWNNSTVDGSFGITSKIYLDQITTNGSLVNSLQVANSSQPSITAKSNQLVTSFPSKSELALNLSADRNILTFMGYVAPINTLDVSNSNTPAVVDPTNPVIASYYRAVAAVDKTGKFTFTETNAYSGNNGRAAYLNNSNGANVIYMAGNAGNGGNPQPNNIILGAGAQIVTPSSLPQAKQVPLLPTPVGSFNITQLGDKADKIGKDTNFRGLTVYNNVVYYTKGSGGNGINTVYFVDTTGTACPNGVGVPSPVATLPTTSISYNAANLQTLGVAPYNMCILKGFPTTLAKTATAFPFGLWFANPTTLYVTDEGNGSTTYTAPTYTGAAAQTTAGLQKWVFDGTQWNYLYTLQSGLDLGVPYQVAKYPTGTNPVTNLPWAPATSGLRNLTGHVNADGTANIYAITSTVSGDGDQGADPNKLVVIKDVLSATTVSAAESFWTLKTAAYGEVLRGVSFTPGTPE